MQQLINSTEKMSSRRIAEKTGKRHDNVVRDIRTMIDELQKDGSNLSTDDSSNLRNDEYEIVTDGRGFTSEILLNERMSICLASGYSTKLRMSIIDDWAAMKASQLSQQIQRPQTNEEILSSAVLLANRLLAEKDERINKLAPKAEWTDKVLQSDANYTTTNIAKELGMGAKQLNTMLCKKKIQYWHDGRYVLYANYENEGYTATRTKPFIDSKGVQHTNMYMVWTERGRAFLHYLFNESLSYGKPAKAKKLTQLNLTTNL